MEILRERAVRTFEDNVSIWRSIPRPSPRA